MRLAVGDFNEQSDLVWTKAACVIVQCFDGYYKVRLWLVNSVIVERNVNGRCRFNVFFSKDFLKPRLYAMLPDNVRTALRLDE